MECPEETIIVSDFCAAIGQISIIISVIILKNRETNYLLTIT